MTAPNHQHFFGARLDFSVDGESNTVHEVNTRSVPSGPENPYGNAFFAEATPLSEGVDARRNTNTPSSRFWRVINPGRKNSLGQPVAYRLCPGRERPAVRTARRLGAQARGLPDQ